MVQLTVSELRAADPADLSPREQAWRGYFLSHPEVVAAWGYSNGREVPLADQAHAVLAEDTDSTPTEENP